MPQPPAFDVFIDLTRSGLTRSSGEDSDLDRRLRELESRADLFGDERRVTLALPPGPADPPDPAAKAVIFREPVAALASALAAAATGGRALAVILGDRDWDVGTLQALCAYAARDPMIAVLQPRFADPAGALLALPGGHEADLPAAAVAMLPEYYVAPESLSALFLLTPRGVAAAPRLEAAGLDDAYGDVLRGLRRRGYRTLVCNRVTVAWPLPAAQAYPPLAEPPGDDGPRADGERPRDMLRDMPERRLEAILAAAFSDGRPRVLLDCRGMPPSFNGTAACVLGFLRGFRRLAGSGLAFTVLASSEAAAFHELAAAFPEFDIQHDQPAGSFLAAILLNQPWSVEAIRELHAVAGLIAFNMLDTIAWDIVYAAGPGLDRSWRLMGQVADTIFFNSAYSRDRYSFRFTPDRRIPLVVTHHSMAPAEILHPPEPGEPAGAPFIVVMGNDYDHKEVAGTLDLLAAAFPATRFVAVGAADAASPHVEALESGHIPAGRMARLFTDAAAIVFPSHYEGFGLPVAEALAYGRPVIVRDCPLWSEIAALTSRPELIESFRIAPELVDAVRRALEDGPPAVAPDRPDGPEPDWEACAGRMLAATQAMIAGFDGRRWLAREALLGRD